jgi:uncharacterized protein
MIMTSNENKGWSRRDFIKGAGAAGLGAIMGLGIESSAGAAAAGGEGGPQVPTRPLGKTGIGVSILSLGDMPDIASNQLLLRQALRWGVTYWDTADCYAGGKSEIGLGKFFERYPEERKRVFLVSKSCERKPEGMTRLLRQSFERLKTDYIDLYYAHGIESIRDIDEETRKWAERAKSEGKIRFFGFSTHTNMEECMSAASRLGWIDGIMMTYNFRNMDADPMKRAVEACSRAGIGLTAMKAQGKPSLPGPDLGSGTAEKLLDRFLKNGFTGEQARLKAVWEHPEIASICSQMPNMAILKANVAAALDRKELGGTDMRLMARYAHETASSYCAGCSHICRSALGDDIPVREVMRYLMYCHGYGERDRARTLYARLPKPVRGRIGVADYSEAERRCPQGMPIGDLMRAAAVELA